MNEYDIKRLALVFALQAEVEGMKAENMQRNATGSSMAYDDSNFIRLAEELNILASKHNDEL